LPTSKGLQKLQPEELIEAESLSMESICHVAIFMASHFAIYFYDCLQTVEHQHEKAARK